MRVVWLCGIIAGIAACHSPQRREAAAPTNPTSAATTTIHGRVAKVHAAGQFAVLRFPPGFMPGRNQVLKVYRGGANIGSVKVTGLQQDTTVVADIVSGEALAGDEVRGD